jgi:hypothetical protein
MHVAVSTAAAVRAPDKNRQMAKERLKVMSFFIDYLLGLYSSFCRPAMTSR